VRVIINRLRRHKRNCEFFHMVGNPETGQKRASSPPSRLMARPLNFRFARHRRTSILAGIGATFYQPTSRYYSTVCSEPRVMRRVIAPALKRYLTLCAQGKLTNAM